MSAPRKPLVVVLGVLLGAALAAGGQLLTRYAPPEEDRLPAVAAGSAERGQSARSPGSSQPATARQGGAAGAAESAEAERTPSSTSDRLTGGTDQDPASGASVRKSPGAVPKSAERVDPATSAEATPASRTRPARRGSRAAQVVELVNEARERAGCRPVRRDARLARSAQRHSDDMSERRYFSHTSPDGVTFAERVHRADYPRPGAENIARGPSGAAGVMRMWLDSSRHRAIITNCSFRSIGVGVTPAGWYWTQNFGY